MLVQRELSLDELLAQMNLLKIEIMGLLDKLHIHANPIKAISYKEILSSSNVHADLAFLNYVKSEEIREEIRVKVQTATDYKKLAVKKIIRMGMEKDLDYMIVFYRDKLHFKWNDIATLVDYSTKQCKRKYDKYKMSHFS